MPYLQWLLFLFGFVSFILYTLIILTIRRQKASSSLSGSFFQIVAIQYYADIAFFFEFTVTMRLRKYGGINELFEPDKELFGVIPRIVSGFHYYIKIVVYIGYLLFATNRFSSAINISAYNSVNISLWTPTVMKRITIAKWVIPLFFVLPTHAWPTFEFWFLVTDSNIRLANDEKSTALVAYVDGIWCLSTCIYCMICYIVTCILIRKHWKHATTDTVCKYMSIFQNDSESFSPGKKTAARTSAERSLLISAMLSFIVLTLNTIVQVVTIVNSWGGMQDLLFIQDLSYPMVDLMYSHFPWVILSTSSVLRKQITYDVKLFIRAKLKLDDASINTIRVGPTASPMTRMTVMRSSIK